MMQLQQMTAFLKSVNKETAIETSEKTLRLISKHLLELDNKLVMEGGSLGEKAKTVAKQDIDKLSKYKLDVLFTLHNLYIIHQDFVKALEYVKQHTQVTEEIFNRKHKSYAYALLLEAQCMSHLPNADHTETLTTINQALAIQVALCQNGKPDVFLARVYEEKGHVLRILAGDITQTNHYNL